MVRLATVEGSEKDGWDVALWNLCLLFSMNESSLPASVIIEYAEGF